MSFANVVQQWFKDERGGSLILPDGWFGRPYDNQHQLTSVNESDEAFILTLDYNLSLLFEGLKSVEVTNRQLVFRQFDKLRFEFLTFGTDRVREEKEYVSGEVKIVPAPG